MYYTNAGVHPVSLYESSYSRYTGLSLHALSGDLWFQQLLFVVAGIVAVAFIVGYRTRLVGVISLVLLISLHARNPAVLNGGDRLLRVLLFVALLAPLGERWSLDALRRGRARSKVVGFATAALLLQPLVVFTQNAILKHEGDTWYSGEAVGIALANDEMTILLGNALQEYGTLLEALTWGWVFLLSGSILCLWLTTGWLRVCFVGIYLSAFAGMLVSMSVGLFPFVLAASVVPFLSTPFWNTLARLVPSSRANWRPRAATLGPLARAPVERRVLASLRERGYDSAASFAISYGRSLLTIASVLVLVWMLLFAGTHASDYEVPAEIDSPHLDEQRWGLYTPDPSESYGWFTVEAGFENESTVEAFEGGDIAADRPPDAAAEYDSFRERKYLEDVRSSGRGETNGLIARNYADHACVRAVDTHGEAVETVTVYRMIQSSPVDGEYEDPRPLTVIEWDCTASEPLDE